MLTFVSRLGFRRPRGGRLAFPFLALLLHTPLREGLGKVRGVAGAAARPQSPGTAATVLGGHRGNEWAAARLLLTLTQFVVSARHVVYYAVGAPLL